MTEFMMFNHSKNMREVKASLQQQINEINVDLKRAQEKAQYNDDYDSVSDDLLKKITRLKVQLNDVNIYLRGVEISAVDRDAPSPEPEFKK